MKTFFKVTIQGVVGLALLAGAVWVFTHYKRESAQQTRKAGTPEPVRVAVVEEGMTSDRVEALGTGSARESVLITASESEKVTGLYFEDGQRVEAGQLLAQLEERLLRAERKIAVATLEDERREMARARELLEKDGIARRAAEARETSLAKAELALEAIDARLEMREVRAPFAGVLGTRQVSLGAFVTPGTVFSTLDDISKIHIDFSVPEKRLATLAEGVLFEARTAAIPGLVITGRVATVEARVDPAGLMARARGTVDNADGRLRPGMSFMVRVEASPRRALWVPEKSLMSLGEVQFVFVPGDDGKVSRREVRLGRRENGMVEVGAGLAAGERVVTDGVGKLRDGAAVEVLVVQTAMNVSRE